MKKEEKCDNIEHQGEENDVREVILTDEFNSEHCYWCYNCRMDNAEMVKETI